MKSPRVPPSELTELTFTPELTRPVAEAAARLAGLDPDGAELLRHQTNAVYRLVTAPVVIKVARPGARHIAEVIELVSWLEKHAVPTVRLWDGVSQPLNVAGVAVTLWEYLPQERSVLAGDIAAPLQALHNTPLPPLRLRPLDPFGEIRYSIEASRILVASDRDMLLERCSTLAHQAKDISFASESVLVHGDAQHRNTLWNPKANCAVLCDWESAAVSHPEWDLVTIEVHCRRFGHAETEYADFCHQYGRDVRDWTGYEWLRDVRELRMITTNGRKAAPGSASEAEVIRRVVGLRQAPPSKWTIL
jgi:hypothetical protein